MRLIVQACILGLFTGGVYALMASGLTLAFGIMRVINVAQGAMIILGAYLSYTAFSVFHIDPFLSILLLTPLVFALGVTVQLAFIRPLRSDEREELSLLVTWAVALAIEGTLSIFYHTNYRSTITTYANTSWRIGGYHVSEVRVFAFAISMAMLAILYLILVAHAVRASDPRDRSEPGLRGPPGHRRPADRGARVRAQRGNGRRGGRRVRDDLPVQPGEPLRPDLAPVGHRRARRLGEHRAARSSPPCSWASREAVLATTISPTWSSFAFFIVLIVILVVRPQGLFGVTERGAM